MVLVGHRGHQEVKGTTGHESMHLVDDREEVELPDWDSDTPVAVLTQTTLSVDDTSRAIEQVQERFSNVVVRNDLCYATTNRQAAAIELAEITELVLVIGAQNSSNCNQLKAVAINKGVPAHLIIGPEELDRSWLEGVLKVGITSGASTPEKQVKAVIEAIAPENVYKVGTGEENTVFAIPRGLRNLVGNGDRCKKDEPATDENN